MTTIYRENDNVYLNVVFDHNGVSFPIDNPPILPIINENSQVSDYNVTKTIPILSKASDFYCSVIRFEIPLDTIPLFIIPIVPNQPNPNLTPLVIGINVAGVNYPQRLIYTPSNNIQPPIQNKPIQVITDYYYDYSIQHFVDMLNTALGFAWISSGLPLTYLGYTFPWFFYDSITSLMSLVVPEYFTRIIAPLIDIPIIYMNEPLQSYLSSFNLKFIGYSQPFGREYDFILNFPTPDKRFIVPGDPLIYYKIVEDYSITEYFVALRKIIIATNTIPISNEFIPVPGNNDSGIAASFPILTDFTPQINLAGQSRSIAYYIPTSQYRLVDLIADVPLQKIDLKIYWVDITGNINPLLISVFQQASIKLAFLRKTLYKNMNQLLLK
jgi:hypothetical protein